METLTIIATGSAGAALAGQTSSGDRGVVLGFPSGALVAVIDGLGHGHDAAVAADEAVRVLSAAPQAPVTELMQRCHDALRKTRGAVISLASFDGDHGQMTWLGVGNVEGVLVRARGGKPNEAIAMRGGTVGYLLPHLNPRTLDIDPGDTLVLATDGIRHGFKEEVRVSRSPQEIADQILERWAKGSDDACAVVARYVGLEDRRRIELGGEADVAQARIQTRNLAHGLGFAVADIEAIATAVSELARNVIVHASHGELVLSPMRSRVGLAVEVRDRGPGIADIERALSDGYTTKSGLGCGLSGARRLVDKLEIDSQEGVGTVVRIEKWLR